MLTIVLYIMKPNLNDIKFQLDEVEKKILSILDNTNLSDYVLSNKNILSSGKMLRSKLVQYLGLTSGTDKDILSTAGAAVDIMHSASLIHDDVIDGGLLRRGNPTFWKQYGINGAILFGDTLMFRSIALLTNQPRLDLLEELINMTGKVCTSEAEQELILRGIPGNWEDCEKIARFKTGSLFAFSAVAGGSGDINEANSLREAGFELGTVYQIADDILDSSGKNEIAGKTLGKDMERGKTTAITAINGAPDCPKEYLQKMLDNSSLHLVEYPNLHDSWSYYIEKEFYPIINQFIY